MSDKPTIIGWRKMTLCIWAVFCSTATMIALILYRTDINLNIVIPFYLSAIATIAGYSIRLQNITDMKKLENP